MAAVGVHRRLTDSYDALGTLLLGERQGRRPDAKAGRQEDNEASAMLSLPSLLYAGFPVAGRLMGRRPISHRGSCLTTL